MPILRTRKMSRSASKALATSNATGPPPRQRQHHHIESVRLTRELRRQLPAGVHLFTGDDYNYTDLIAGDGQHHSDALLGAFAVLGRPASAALVRLDAGDPAGFREILAPTEALSRLVFAAPTQFYKVGVAWLAYLEGAQDHFRMIGGFETGRSLGHLGDLVRAADRIGLFRDPGFTARRAAVYFAAQGIG